VTLPSSSRGGQKVRLVVLHTAEGASDTASLYAYFDRTQAASCHAGIDEHGVADGWVPYDRAAWTLRNANAYSDNAEICGWAKWTRADWLAHPGMLAGAAAWVRSRCTARGIPMVKLSPAEVKAGRAGVCGHVDYTQATGDGTHWDPGPNFPWDIVIAAARGGGGTSGEEDDMPTAEEVAKAVWNEALRNYAQPGWFSARDGVSFAHQEAFRNREISAKLDTLLAKAGGASADEVAAKLLPALTTAMVAAVSEIDVSQVDRVSDEDVAQIAEAVVQHAGDLLSGRMS